METMILLVQMSQWQRDTLIVGLNKPKACHAGINFI